MSRNYLFHDKELREVLEAKIAEMADEVGKIERDQLLNTSVEDLCTYLVEEYAIDPLTLHEDRIATLDPADTQIDVSQDPMRGILDRSQPFHITGTAVTIVVPFDGDPKLFRYRPSRRSTYIPQGEIHGQELQLRFELTDPDAEELRRRFDDEFKVIRSNAGYCSSQVEAYNRGLSQHARTIVEARRKKLLKDQGLVAGLGFPLRERSDSPKTYAVPSVRRKITPQMPAASTAPYTPEPTLAMEHYEHILSVIQKMVLVMERSRQAFKNMEEEHLRDHFLVQLNGHYDSEATGETFNGEGKTDILIRHEGKNLFIAECKFWGGPKSLTDAIDQLLSYATWRDGKLALVVFNKRKDFSAVLAKIPETVKEHPNHKRQLDYDPETGFRFIVHHPDDVNRELTLTVLAFEVPT